MHTLRPGSVDVARVSRPLSPIGTTGTIHGRFGLDRASTIFHHGHTLRTVVVYDNYRVVNDYDDGASTHNLDLYIALAGRHVLRPARQRAQFLKQLPPVGIRVDFSNQILCELLRLRSALPVHVLERNGAFVNHCQNCRAIQRCILQQPAPPVKDVQDAVTDVGVIARHATHFGKGQRIRGGREYELVAIVHPILSQAPNISHVPFLEPFSVRLRLAKRTSPQIQDKIRQGAYRRGIQTDAVADRRNGKRLAEGKQHGRRGRQIR
mmetsp:Transcript_36962/g.78850  ORF Transcript_36962/g.78850 Transcript_36962/m.78850 type:complete len:265 (-) Transcript_36962:265-1059(-)